MRCGNCGFENPEGMKFCGQCTNPLALICPKCRFENPPGFKFCGQCGAALQAGALVGPRPSEGETSLEHAVRMVPERSVADAHDEERKTVTALFADIKGSMELIEDLDPEEARAIVDAAPKILPEIPSRLGDYAAHELAQTTTRVRPRPSLITW